MKAEEIRTHQDMVVRSVREVGQPMAKIGKDLLESMNCWVLHEIVAQLAELNFTLATLSGLRVSLTNWCNEYQAETLFWRGFHYCPKCYPHIHKEALGEHKTK